MAQQTELAALLQKQIARGKAGKLKTCDAFKQANLKLLRVLDEQTAVRRYKWTNLPKGLNSTLIERILYYRGQGIFFKIPLLDRYMFLPYSPVGGIDVYGRAKGCTPLPFGGTSSTTGLDNTLKPWILGFQLKPIYLNLDLGDIKPLEACVIIRDYTQQRPLIIIPRQQLNDPLLDVMSDCVPFMRTALVNSTGIKGLRINDQSEYTAVLAANDSIQKAALNGQWAVPIIGHVDFQELTSGSSGRVQDFLLAQQGLLNYRLSTYGIPNSGVFEKKEHKLLSEQEQNSSNESYAWTDSKLNRLVGILIINKVFGLDIGLEETMLLAMDIEYELELTQEEVVNDLQ